MSAEEKTRNVVASTSSFKIAESERLGRYLLAAKNFSAGEVVLREKPIAVGPAAFNNEYLCFACLCVLPKVNNAVQYTCTRCNVAPLCSVACEKQIGHHTLDECELFRSNANLSISDVAEIIGVLLPFRLWLLKKRDAETWEKINSMESHMEERRDTPIWKDRELNIINNLRALRLIPECEAVTTDFLQQICGILDVNTFELRSPGGLDCLLLRGLYNEASLMAHDCRGNTHLTVDDSFQLTVYASQPIKENEPIMFNYTSSLLGTAERREHLREGKYFECDCALCKDPYELKSHLSTLKCPRCKDGLVGIQNPLVVDPYEKNVRWLCELCRRTYSGRLVKATLNITRALIDECDDSDIKAMELLVKKLSRSLHPSHSLMLALKQKLLGAYRKEVASLNPQKKIIQQMLDLGKDVYNVLDIVEPGISRLKGILLYEMHLPVVLLANRAYTNREITTTELASRLEEAAGVLKKALSMLLLEPVATPEGRLAKRALQELKVLNININDVKSLPPEEPKTHTRKPKEKRKKGK